jgi:uracil-DNA glycosylase
MKIQELFNAYSKQVEDTKNINSIFEDSKMVNKFAKLDYGFFPLGSGVLVENESKIEVAELNPCEIMVLGNDFGTLKYLTDECKDNREKASNPTIRNLSTIELNLQTTFFTNLYLGVRTEGKNTDSKTVKKAYQDFCFTFLDKQLEIMNPKIVLCLGQKVADSLSEHLKGFPNLSKKPISQLFLGNNQSNYCFDINGRKFIVIPHPSFAHINWAKNDSDIKHKIMDAIKM